MGLLRGLMGSHKAVGALAAVCLMAVTSLFGMAESAHATEQTPAVAAAPAAAPAPAPAAKPVAVKKKVVKKADEFADDEPQGIDKDPLEPLNRAIFEFNRTLDGMLVRPVTQVYRGVVPEQGREMVSNFLGNLYSPVVFANSVLQADPQNSFATLWRFILNSTLGVLGIFDFAGDVVGLHNRDADLGQTFAMYGADEGPYLVLPLIGPSNVRDGFGRLGDMFFVPTNYADSGWVSVAAYTAMVIDTRSNNMQVIDDVFASSLDPYATFRSGYTQKRASDIKRAKASRDAAQEKAKAQ
jgi:phospholipid-binding lipoprotein MlaA